MPQYNGVWTLQSQAQALTKQQWVTDPNFNSTTLLLQADNAANSAQNNTFLDSSTNSFAITRNGNTTQGSFTPFSQAPGYWSNYFNGSTDYLSFTDSSNVLDIGTVNASFEAWIYSLAIPASAVVINAKGGGIGSWNATNGWEYIFGIDSTNKLYLQTYTSGSGVNTLTAASPLVLNTWNHVVFATDTLNNISLFINGNRVATVASMPVGKPTTRTSCFISYQTTNSFAGYISNIRFVSGSNAYSASSTSITVPTSILTTVSGTQLLTCQSNRFVDTSSNAFPLTLTGTPSIQAFSPFAPQYQWTPTVIGGSGYFDGASTTYLTTPAAGQFAPTGNFTIGLWCYPTSTKSFSHAIGNYNSAGSTTWLIEITNGTGVNFYTNGTTIRISSSGIQANAWNYISIVRSGTTITGYINGTSVGTYTQSGTFGSATVPISVGRGGSSTGSTDYFLGYISNPILIDGSAVTSVPTAPSTPVSGTQLLLNFTNAGIYDGTMKNIFQTVANTQVSTSVVKYGSGSIYFDGTGDWLVGPRSWSVGARENFTVEGWFYFGATVSTTRMILSDYNSGTPGASKYFSVNATGVELQFGSIAATVVTSTTTFAPNNWYHIAAVRNNNIVSIYVNGVAQTVTNPTQTNAFLDQGTILYVGRWGGTTTYEWIGYMDDLRFTKSVARYTANFTPPLVALPRQ